MANLQLGVLTGLHRHLANEIVSTICHVKNRVVAIHGKSGRLVKLCVGSYAVGIPDGPTSHCGHLPCKLTVDDSFFHPPDAMGVGNVEITCGAVDAHHDTPRVPEASRRTNAVGKTSIGASS